MASPLSKTRVLKTSPKMVVEINTENGTTFYTRLQYKLYKVAHSATVVNDDIIDQLVEAEVVDYNEVEGLTMRDIFRSFHKKEKDIIIKFLNELCNLKDNPLTAQRFRNVISQAYPRSVVPVVENPVVVEEHLSRPRSLKRSFKIDSGYGSSEVKRSKSCLDVNLSTSTHPEFEFASQNILMGNPRDRRLSLPANYLLPDSPENQILADIQSTLINPNVLPTETEVDFSKSTTTDHTCIQVEQGPVTSDSENAENEQPLLNESSSSNRKSKGIAKSVKKLVVGTATVICSGIAGALAYRYGPWGNSIEIPINPILSTQLPIYNNIESTTVINTNDQDIIRYERVLQNGMRQYSFDRQRNKP